MSRDINVQYGLYNLQEEREQARWSLGYILDDFADMKRCDLFICKFMTTCIIGVGCDNGKAPACRLALCEVCRMQKNCKKDAVNKKCKY